MIFSKSIFINWRIKSYVSSTDLPAVCVLCLLTMKKKSIFAQFYCISEPSFQKTYIKNTVQSQIWGPQTAYCTVSIKQPGLEFLQKSLLNVPFNQKNVGLDILSYSTYNRVMIVVTLEPQTVEIKRWE